MTVHCMVDLETMSTRPDAAIVQVGACKFSMDDAPGGSYFDRSVSLASSIDAGLAVDGDTVSWWMEQDKAAQDSLLRGRLPLGRTLEEFAAWFARPPVPKLVWANSPSFDLVILRNAYRAVGLRCPWHYRQERDFRTFCWLAGGLVTVPEVPAPTTRHVAVEDARYQALVVAAAAAKMKELI